MLFPQGEFSSLYMMVNASLSVRNPQLFELSGGHRTVSLKRCNPHLPAPRWNLASRALVCVQQVTIQVSKETLGGIPIWIIIISILIGILILAFVIFVLWKVNLCIKRNQRILFSSYRHECGRS